MDVLGSNVVVTANAWDTVSGLPGVSSAVHWLPSMNGIGFPWWLWLLTGFVAGGLIFLAIRLKRLYWLPFAFSSLFVIINIGVWQHIVRHPNEGSWATSDRTSPLNLEIGKTGLGPLDSAVDKINVSFGGIETSINDVLVMKDDVFAFMHAFNVAMEFAVAAFWGGCIAIPMLIVALIIGHRRNKKDRKAKIVEAVEEQHTEIINDLVAALVQEEFLRVLADPNSGVRLMIQKSLKQQGDAYNNALKQQGDAYNESLTTIASHVEDISVKTGVDIPWRSVKKLPRA